MTRRAPRTRELEVEVVQAMLAAGERVTGRSLAARLGVSQPTGICLSAVATLGLDEARSRIGPVVDTIVVLDACELISCTEAAKASIEGQQRSPAAAAGLGRDVAASMVPTYQGGSRWPT